MCSVRTQWALIGHSSDPSYIDDRPNLWSVQAGMHLLPSMEATSSVSLLTVSGLISVSGSGKEGQKGHRWAPRGRQGQ